MIYELKTIQIKLRVKDNQDNASSPKQAYEIAKAIFNDLDADQEHMILLALDSANQIKGYKVISSGGQNSTDPDFKIIFRNALLLGAVSIILVHNHPSGETRPSVADEIFTRKVKEAGEILSIPVLDHLIIGKDGFEEVRR